MDGPVTAEKKSGSAAPYGNSMTGITGAEVPSGKPNPERRNTMGIILIIILVILLVGTLPTWRHSKSWGPYPSGGIGLVLLILLILLLLGRI